MFCISASLHRRILSVLSVWQFPCTKGVIYYILCSMHLDLVFHTLTSPTEMCFGCFASPLLYTDGYSVFCLFGSSPAPRELYTISYVPCTWIWCSIPLPILLKCVLDVLHLRFFTQTDTQCSVCLAVPLHQGSYILYPMFHALGSGVPYPYQSY